MNFIHAQFIKNSNCFLMAILVAFKTNAVYCDVLSKVNNACILQ
jgi:hypothetical protein